MTVRVCASSAQLSRDLEIVDYHLSFHPVKVPQAQSFYVGHKLFWRITVSCAKAGSKCVLYFATPSI